jgi:hypothetical protein
LWQEKPGGAWEVAYIPDKTGKNLRFSRDTNLFVTQSAGYFKVFGISPEKHLIRYKGRSRSIKLEPRKVFQYAYIWLLKQIGSVGGVFSALRTRGGNSTRSQRVLMSNPIWLALPWLSGWWAKDLTAESTVSADSELAHDYLFEPPIVAFSSVQLLGRTGSSTLVEVSKSTGRWEKRSWSGLGPYVDSPLYATYGPNGDRYIYCVRKNGSLVRYLSPRNSNYWIGTELSNLPRMQVKEMEGSPCLAISPGEDVHIVGIADGANGLVHLHALRAYSWHTRGEYRRWAAGLSYGFGDFKYVPKNKNDGNAYAAWGYHRADCVQMKCPSFEKGPGHRAGIMLHEATHHYYKSGKHTEIEGKDGEKTKKDYWFHHGCHDVPLATETAVPHSSYQVEVEFLADIAVFPAAWVPADVRSDAKSTANRLLGARFINDPGFVVGEPRPLWDVLHFWLVEG